MEGVITTTIWEEPIGTRLLLPQPKNMDRSVRIYTGILVNREVINNQNTAIILMTGETIIAGYDPTETIQHNYSNDCYLPSTGRGREYFGTLTYNKLHPLLRYYIIPTEINNTLSKMHLPEFSQASPLSNSERQWHEYMAIMKARATDEVKDKFKTIIDNQHSEAIEMDKGKIDMGKSKIGIYDEYLYYDALIDLAIFRQLPYNLGPTENINRFIEEEISIVIDYDSATYYNHGNIVVAVDNFRGVYSEYDRVLINNSIGYGDFRLGKAVEYIPIINIRADSPVYTLDKTKSLIEPLNYDVVSQITAYRKESIVTSDED